MQQEEKQEQMNGKDEARRESEGIGTGDQVGNRKRNGKEKGDGEWRGGKRRVGGMTRQECKGRGETGSSEGLGRLVARQRSGMDE